MASNPLIPQIISRQEAKARGLKRYFTGKPCKYGHIAERLVSNKTCLKCIAEYQKQPSELQRRRQYDKLRRDNNIIYKEIQRIAGKKYGKTQRGRQKKRARQTKYRARPEINRKIQIYNNKYAKLYRATESGKEKRLIHEHNRRARKAENGGDLSAEDIAHLRKTQKKCYLCGVRFTKDNLSTIEHVIPLSKGGRNDITNVMLACMPCNLRKSKTILQLL